MVSRVTRDFYKVAKKCTVCIPPLLPPVLPPLPFATHVSGIDASGADGQVVGMRKKEESDSDGGAVNAGKRNQKQQGKKGRKVCSADQRIKSREGKKGAPEALGKKKTRLAGEKANHSQRAPPSSGSSALLVEQLERAFPAGLMWLPNTLSLVPSPAGAAKPPPTSALQPDLKGCVAPTQHRKPLSMDKPTSCTFDVSAASVIAGSRRKVFDPIAINASARRPTGFPRQFTAFLDEDTLEGVSPQFAELLRLAREAGEEGKRGSEKAANNGKEVGVESSELRGNGAAEKAFDDSLAENVTGVLPPRKDAHRTQPIEPSLNAALDLAAWVYFGREELGRRSAQFGTSSGGIEFTSMTHSHINSCLHTGMALLGRKDVSFMKSASTIPFMIGCDVAGVNVSPALNVRSPTGEGTDGTTARDGPLVCSAFCRVLVEENGVDGDSSVSSFVDTFNALSLENYFDEEEQRRYAEKLLKERAAGEARAAEAKKTVLESLERSRREDEATMVSQTKNRKSLFEMSKSDFEAEQERKRNMAEKGEDIMSVTDAIAKAGSNECFSELIRKSDEKWRRSTVSLSSGQPTSYSIDDERFNSFCSIDEDGSLLGEPEGWGFGPGFGVEKLEKAAQADGINKLITSQSDHRDEDAEGLAAIGNLSAELRTPQLLSLPREFVPLGGYTERSAPEKLFAFESLLKGSETLAAFAILSKRATDMRLKTIQSRSSSACSPPRVAGELPADRSVTRPFSYYTQQLSGRCRGVLENHYDTAASSSASQDQSSRTFVLPSVGSRDLGFFGLFHEGSPAVRRYDGNIARRGDGFALRRWRKVGGRYTQRKQTRNLARRAILEGRMEGYRVWLQRVKGELIRRSMIGRVKAAEREAGTAQTATQCNLGRGEATRELPSMGGPRSKIPIAFKSYGKSTRQGLKVPTGDLALDVLRAVKVKEEAADRERKMLRDVLRVEKAPASQSVSSSLRYLRRRSPRTLSSASADDLLKYTTRVDDPNLPRRYESPTEIQQMVREGQGSSTTDDEGRDASSMIALLEKALRIAMRPSDIVGDGGGGSASPLIVTIPYVTATPVPQFRIGEDKEKAEEEKVAVSTLEAVRKLVEAGKINVAAEAVVNATRELYGTHAAEKVALFTSGEDTAKRTHVKTKTKPKPRLPEKKDKKRYFLNFGTLAIVNESFIAASDVNFASMSGVDAAAREVMKYVAAVVGPDIDEGCRNRWSSILRPYELGSFHDEAVREILAEKSAAVNHMLRQHENPSIAERRLFVPKLLGAETKGERAQILERRSAVWRRLRERRLVERDNETRARWGLPLLNVPPPCDDIGLSQSEETSTSQSEREGSETAVFKPLDEASYEDLVEFIGKTTLYKRQQRENSAKTTQRRKETLAIRRLLQRDEKYKRIELLLREFTRDFVMPSTINVQQDGTLFLNSPVVFVNGSSVPRSLAELLYDLGSDGGISMERKDGLCCALEHGHRISYSIAAARTVAEVARDIIIDYSNAAAASERNGLSSSKSSRGNRSRGDPEQDFVEATNAFARAYESSRPRVVTWAERVSKGYTGPADRSRIPWRVFYGEEMNDLDEQQNHDGGTASTEEMFADSEFAEKILFPE